jgi:ribonuclease HI
MMAKSVEPFDVVLYTDGACSGNPGPGGWACILKHVGSDRVRELAGGAPETTNNRMELQAVIEGLRALTRPCRVKVVTDSEYVARGMQEWLPNWIANGWRRKVRGRLEPVKNVEYWQALSALCDKHDVTFEHVRGHAGHPENEACDRMAVEQAKLHASGAAADSGAIDIEPPSRSQRGVQR